jgi:hypothetical protein
MLDFEEESELVFLSSCCSEKNILINSYHQQEKSLITYVCNNSIDFEKKNNYK